LASVSLLVEGVIMFNFRTWIRKTFVPLVGASAAAALMTGQAKAGNIILTGHDDDFHFFGGFGDPNAGNQLSAMASFARDGSALPVLVLDQGTEMSSALTALGVTNVAVNPLNTPAMNAAMGSLSTYSAIAIASASNCGGCDNSNAAYSAIDGYKTTIDSFISAGGGILQTTGGTSTTSRALAYAYLPDTTGTPAAFPPSSGYVQTADGASIGVPAVNGDPTHNFFLEPGSPGMSSVWKVAERLGSPDTGTPETVFIAGARVTGTHITSTSTPEPATLGLAAMGLATLAGYTWRKRKGKGIVA
jgi:hypothetical protein